MENPQLRPSSRDDEEDIEDINGKVALMREVLQEVAASPQALSSTAASNAYLEALQKAPQLIERESNPILFLRRERGDIEAACKRLFAYWTHRKQIFGEKLAFKPLELGSAICPEALGYVKSGSFVRLPCDKQGRDVFMIDGTRRPKGVGKPMDLETRARFLFFMLSLSFANPKTQTEGIVLILYVSEKATLSIPNWKVIRDLVQQALPFKAHCVHIAGCPTPGSRSLLADFVVPKYAEAHGCWCEGKPNVKVHLEDSEQDMLRKLTVYGLKKEGLPKSLGGTWEYEEWDKEVARLIGTKQVAKSSDGKKSASCGGKEPLKKRVAVSSLKPPPSQQQAKQEHSSNHGAARKRSADSGTTLPAAKKAKAAPKILPAKVLMEEVLESPDMPVPCKETRRTFSKDTMRKYGAAKAAVVPRTEDEEDTDGATEKGSFRKKMNVIYCRRKYYKRKLKFETLVNTHGSLLMQNKNLKNENERLEDLMRKATQIVLEQESAGQVASVTSSSAFAAPALPPSQVSTLHRSQDALMRSLLSRQEGPIEAALARQPSLQGLQLGNSAEANRLLLQQYAEDQNRAADLQLLSNLRSSRLPPVAEVPSYGFPSVSATTHFAYACRVCSFLVCSHSNRGLHCFAQIPPVASLPGLAHTTDDQLLMELQRSRLASNMISPASLSQSNLFSSLTHPPMSGAFQQRSDPLFGLYEQQAAQQLEAQNLLRSQQEDLMLQLLVNNLRSGGLPPGI